MNSANLRLFTLIYVLHKSLCTVTNKVHRVPHSLCEDGQSYGVVNEGRQGVDRQEVWVRGQDRGQGPQHMLQKVCTGRLVWDEWRGATEGCFNS